MERPAAVRPARKAPGSSAIVWQPVLLTCVKPHQRCLLIAKVDATPIKPHAAGTEKLRAGRNV